MTSLHGGLGDRSGFSLVEVLAVVAVIAILAAMAVPGMVSEVELLKLGIAERDVQSELQSARLKAVSGNTYIRVRFNCPTSAQFRRVERLGSIRAADAGDDSDGNAVTRCNSTTYPYYPLGTGSDKSLLTKPNVDGPLKTLQSGVSFSTASGITTAAAPAIEFWPDGSVHQGGGVAPNAWPQLTANVTIVLVKNTRTKTITVTPLGNIQMER